jgi:hypothetical protein
VPVVFKSMTVQNAQFVDEKRPLAFSSSDLTFCRKSAAGKVSMDSH